MMINNSSNLKYKLLLKKMVYNNSKNNKNKIFWNRN